MNTNWDTRFLDMAKFVASWSKDPGTQVGAVIVRPNKSVISVGFNGFPAGMSDDPELYANREEKLSRMVHAEVNALLYAGRELPIGTTLYTYPFMSCDRCAAIMLQAGIKNFVAPKLPKVGLWGESMIKARKYIDECGGELIEV